MSTIVVGVDGSRASHEALSWALEEARLRGATLRLVTAWSPPDARGFDVPDSLRPELEKALEQVGAHVIEDALEDVTGGTTPDVAVERQVIRKPPAEALLGAAGDADLLVLGSRGRGGFAELLLGSVSHQCAAHARCPVVIVRAPWPESR